MLLALTGGIATGKSTFSRMLSERHAFTLFDADACVHDLLRQDSAVIEAIQDAFGFQVASLASGVDRGALRQIVFSDPRARLKLESILHPRVHAVWQQLRSECLSQNRDFLADIPLLFETGGDEFFEARVVVSSSDAVQRDRMASRGLDPATIKAMLASQLPLSEKIARATAVVWNDGSLEALSRQATLLLEKLLGEARDQ